MAYKRIYQHAQCILQYLQKFIVICKIATKKIFCEDFQGVVKTIEFFHSKKVGIILEKRYNIERSRKIISLIKIFWFAEFSFLCRDLYRKNFGKGMLEQE